MLNREVSFLIMLLASLAISAVCKMFRNFRYKRELLSLIGILQLSHFCGWDIIHLFVLSSVGIVLITVFRCSPRVVFIYSVLHRIFFSCSTFFGLPRDESNLANATMFVATLKADPRYQLSINNHITGFNISWLLLTLLTFLGIIVVSYEIHDYRNEKRRDKSDRETDKIKWLNIEREPTAFEILCFMTCFLALFTGPVFRYKTYHDMLHNYVDIPVREELKQRCKIFVILAILFVCFYTYSTDYYRDGRFYEHDFATRLLVMSIIALTQGIKYTLCWMMVEAMCVLVGLGAYPILTEPMPGKGPSKKLLDTEMDENMTCNFETISNSKFLETLAAPTVKETLQNWNQCTQWWLAFFIYSSSIFPAKWKLARVAATLCVSAVLHGIKIGYYMSFPMLLFPLAAETIWIQNIEHRIAEYKSLYAAYKMFTWVFFKSMVFFFMINIFMLQKYDEIMKFCNSLYFYGYTISIVYLLLGLLVSYAFPKKISST